MITTKKVGKSLPLFFINDIEPTKHREAMMCDVNIEDMTKGKLLVLTLSLFFIVEIEQIEHQYLMMHDVNIKDNIKANYQF